MSFFDPKDFLLARHIAGDAPSILMVDPYTNAGLGTRGVLTEERGFRRPDPFEIATTEAANPHLRAGTFAPRLRNGFLAVDADGALDDPETYHVLLAWLQEHDQPHIRQQSGSPGCHHVIIAPRRGTAIDVYDACKRLTPWNVIIGGTAGAFLRMVGSPPKADAKHGPRLLDGVTQSEAVAFLPKRANTAGIRDVLKARQQTETGQHPGPIRRATHALSTDYWELIKDGTGIHATADRSQTTWRAAGACIQAGYTRDDWVSLATDPTNIGLAHVHSKGRAQPKDWAVGTYQLRLADLEARTPGPDARPHDPVLCAHLRRATTHAHQTLKALGRHVDLAVYDTLVRLAHRAGTTIGLGASARQVCELAGLSDARHASRALRALQADGLIRLVTAYDPDTEEARAGRASHTWEIVLTDATETNPGTVPEPLRGAVEEGCVMTDRAHPGTPPSGAARDGAHRDRPGALQTDSVATPEPPRGAVEEGCVMGHTPLAVGQSPFVSTGLGGLGHAAAAVYDAIASGATTLTQIAPASGRTREGHDLTRAQARSLARRLQALTDIGLVTRTTRGYRPTRRRPATVARALGVPGALAELRDRHHRQRTAWLDRLQTRHGRATPPLDQERYLREADIPDEDLEGRSYRRWPRQARPYKEVA